MSIPRPIDEIEFVGLIGNRLLTEVTTNEFMNALAKSGWGEAQNALILMRMRERGRCGASGHRTSSPGPSATGRLCRTATVPFVASVVTANAGSSTETTRAD